jgi:hypothetical protein
MLAGRKPAVPWQNVSILRALLPMQEGDSDWIYKPEAPAKDPTPDLASGPSLALQQSEFARPATNFDICSQSDDFS